MSSADLTRRAVLAGAGAAGVLLSWGEARATPGSMEAAIAAFTRGAPTAPGGVSLEVPALVENGSAAAVRLKVESAMEGEDRVLALALFSEWNPLPEVATFRFSALSGRADVQTRIRLAGSQVLVAIAAMADGTFRETRVALTVGVPGCGDG